MFELILNQKIDEIADMLVKKNNSYGNSYFKTREEFGKIVFLIRLTDKLNRLKMLVETSKDEYFESYEDTIKDIIGYCLLELIHNDMKKEDR